MKPRTRKFKTLKGLLRTLKTKGYGQARFTLEDYIYSRIYLQGYYSAVPIELSYDAHREAAILFAKAVWSTPSAIDKYAFAIENYSGKSDSLFTSVWIELNRKGELNSTFCAAQDYNVDKAALQHLLN